MIKKKKKMIKVDKGKQGIIRILNYIIINFEKVDRGLKLDRDNRPLTDKLHHFVQKKKKKVLHVTPRLGG